MLSARDAIALCQLMEQYRIHFWVMGGWGVDALLQRETRPHKDLDILVLLGDLSALHRMLDANSFTLKLVWEESRWVDSEPNRWPTAFVMADADGRELDVHIIAIAPDGTIIQHYGNPWPFPTPLTAKGTIAGVAVTCVSRDTQLAMHTGYPLPATHRRDLDLMRSE